MPNLTAIGKMRWLQFLFLLSLTFSSRAQVVLDWELFHPLQQKWLPFGQAGTVQEFLWHSGELPDPFYAENEHKYQWIETHKWVFRSQFFLNEDFYNADTLQLRIPNLDTYAQLYINGKFLARTDNFFVKYAFQIPVKALNCGYNTIEIQIESPVCYHGNAEKQPEFVFPAPNDVAEQKVAPLTRKPQYHFGWDWAPRMVTMGFAYPIEIAVQEPIAVDYLLVNTLDLHQNEAKIELKGKLKGSAALLQCKSKHFQDFQTGTQQDFQLECSIQNPQLWWPNGQGLQHLYHDTLRFYDAGGALVYTHPFTFGIRKVALLQAPDQWGTSFSFQINGRSIFAKGANVIPPGIFAGLALDSAYVALVPQMQAANFNMVRIWGGGMYAPEAFMAACDRAGIMVWHDFMFACAMYPGDGAFLTNIEQEVKQQISRLAAHPSLVYFNGNNEVDVAWHNWGFQGQYHLNEKNQAEIERAYQLLFRQILPTQVQAFTNGAIPYVHTSPLSNWGKDENFNYGTMHYWGVWHGKDPLSDFATKIGRFNAEYGFQSFPELSTISRFAPVPAQHLHSSVMKNHQKSYVGNGMIEKHAKHYFGKADDFRQFVYFSQLTQRKAVSMAIAGHRATAPRCMGTVYWQLNDCWPAPTWSSLDDHNNWKALHYAVKDDFRSIAVLEQVVDEQTFLVLSSDLPDDTLVTVQIEFYNSNGQLQNTQRRTYPLQNNTAQVLVALSNDQNGFVKVILDEKYQRLFTFIPKRKAPKLQPTLKIELLDPVLKKAVVQLESPLPLVDFWIFSENQELHFELNFESLLPGRHRLEFTYEDQLPTLGEISYFLR